MSSKITTMLENSLHHPFGSDEDLIKDINKPFTYLTSIPGKAIRLNFVEVFAQWIKIPKEKEEIIKKIAYLMHNGSLMLDDMQDFSDLRRGVPTAHTVYGIAKTAISLDYVAASLYQLIADVDNIEFAKWALESFRQGLAGQGTELYWRDKYMCPTVQEYVLTVHRKTGFIFVFIIKALNILSSGKPVDVYRLAIAIGVYFQINDDYQNLNNNIYHDSKGFCEDITEGKYSFPIIHAVRNFPEEGKEIVDIMKMRTLDVEEKKRCWALIEKCGSFEYTKKVLIELKSVINTETKRHDHNPLLAEFLEKAIFFSL